MFWLLLDARAGQNQMNEIRILCISNCACPNYIVKYCIGKQVERGDDVNNWIWKSARVEKKRAAVAHNRPKRFVEKLERKTHVNMKWEWLSLHDNFVRFVDSEKQ